MPIIFIPRDLLVFYEHALGRIDLLHPRPSRRVDPALERAVRFEAVA